MTVRMVINGVPLDVASLGQPERSLYTPEGAEEAVQLVQRAAREEFADHARVSPTFLLFVRQFGPLLADPPTLLMVAPRSLANEQEKDAVAGAVQRMVDQFAAVGVVSTIECWWTAQKAGATRRSECVLVCLEHESQNGAGKLWLATIQRGPHRLGDWEALPDAPREDRRGRFMFMQHRRPS